MRFENIHFVHWIDKSMMRRIVVMNIKRLWNVISETLVTMPSINVSGRFWTIRRFITFLTFESTVIRSVIASFVVTLNRNTSIFVFVFLSSP